MIKLEKTELEIITERMDIALAKTRFRAERSEIKAQSKAKKKQLKKNIVKGHYHEVGDDKQKRKMFQIEEVTDAIITLGKLFFSGLPLLIFIIEWFAVFR